MARRWTNDLTRADVTPEHLWLNRRQIMAGTLGNLYDRAGLHGLVDANGAAIYGVRDFLLFTFGNFHWPVFNFADVFLVTGAIMLGIQSLRAEATENLGDSAASETGSDPSARAVA